VTTTTKRKAMEKEEEVPPTEQKKKVKVSSTDDEKSLHLPCSSPWRLLLRSASTEACWMFQATTSGSASSMITVVDHKQLSRAW
jgi:hypothetical protein